MGNISDKNTRYVMTINKEDKKALEELARKQNRRFNNLIQTILKEYIEKNKEQSK